MGAKTYGARGRECAFLLIGVLVVFISALSSPTLALGVTQRTAAVQRSSVTSAVRTEPAVEQDDANANARGRGRGRGNGIVQDCQNAVSTELELRGAITSGATDIVLSVNTRTDPLVLESPIVLGQPNFDLTFRCCKNTIARTRTRGSFLSGGIGGGIGGRGGGGRIGGGGILSSILSFINPRRPRTSSSSGGSSRSDDDNAWGSMSTSTLGEDHLADVEFDWSDRRGTGLNRVTWILDLVFDIINQATRGRTPDPERCLVTRTRGGTGGFLVTAGGRNQLTFDSIDFFERASPPRNPVPLIRSEDGAFGSASSVTITNCIFRGFQAGAISIASLESSGAASRFVVQYSAFRDNFVNGSAFPDVRAAAVNIQQASSSIVVIAESSFVNNTQFYDNALQNDELVASAVLVEVDADFAATVAVMSSTFRDNENALAAGSTFNETTDNPATGALLVNGATDVLVDGCTFNRNEAFADRVTGIDIFGTTSVTIRSTDVRNTESSTGRAANVQNTDTITVQDSTFARNSGGGILVNAPEVNVLRSTFRDNVALGDETRGGNTVASGAGAFFFNATDVLVDACIFDNNTALIDGGGLLIEQFQTDAVFNVTNSQFIGNTANLTTAGDGNGGGILIDVERVNITAVINIPATTTFTNNVPNSFFILPP